MCREKEWFREDCRERQRAIERRDEKRHLNDLEPWIQEVLRPICMSALGFCKTLHVHTCVLLLTSPSHLGLDRVEGLYYT